MTDILVKNVKNVQNKIIASTPAGKQPATLVAVTKYVDAGMIRQLHALGINDFGENRPDVFLEKYHALYDIRDELHWHFIGNLQRRPVKKIINKIDYLHSLDRLSLAEEIQKRADHRIDTFLEINVSGESSKSGFQLDKLSETVEKLANYDKLHIIGLMTMASKTATDDELHCYFEQLHFAQTAIQQKQYTHAPCKELSMGMSRDYHIACKEGASYVRVGTALFKDL